MNNSLKNRYEFVFLFDVKDGNPNGDPQMDNQPRMDLDTQQGLVSDVCIKRKVRNYVQLLAESGELQNFNDNAGKPLNPDNYNIFIRDGNVLNNIIDEEKRKEDGDGKKTLVNMCEKYWDIRTFGAVLSTGSNSQLDEDKKEKKSGANKVNDKKSKGRKGVGTVRGPIQFVFARSIDPIDCTTHALTRCCVTKEEDISKESTFGQKSTVSYGLYRMHGYVSAFDAQKFHFTEDDLAILWKALANAFEYDHAAARGEMNARALIVFKHDSMLGNAPANKLFDLVKIEKKDKNTVARSFSDYTVTVDTANCPEKVTIEELI